MWRFRYTDELYHHGVKGMKWGIRKDDRNLENNSDYGIINTYPNVKSASDFPTVQLERREYAHVMSEIATNITNEQRTHNIVHKYIGDHLYTFENNHDGTFRVIGKEPNIGAISEMYERLMDDEE